jgi:hypothetical protein
MTRLLTHPDEDMLYKSNPTVKFYFKEQMKRERFTGYPEMKKALRVYVA